jgi:hypothetical protein
MGIDVRQVPTHCLPIAGGKGPDGVAGSTWLGIGAGRGRVIAMWSLPDDPEPSGRNLKWTLMKKGRTPPTPFDSLWRFRHQVRAEGIHRRAGVAEGRLVDKNLRVALAYLATPSLHA